MYIAHRKNRSGFTLIELIGVMSVLVLLSGMVLGIAKPASSKANESDCKKRLQQAMIKIDAYRSVNSRVPGDKTDGANWVTELAQRNETSLASGGEIDPWGQNIQYRRVREEGRFIYEVGSVGEDGQYGRANFDDNGDGVIDDVAELGYGDDITNRNGSM